MSWFLAYSTTLAFTVAALGLQGSLLRSGLVGNVSASVICLCLCNVHLLSASAFCYV